MSDFQDGYDVEVVDKVNNDLVCVICAKLMRDAVEMHCGHGMCDGCFKNLLQSCRQRNVDPSCPYCRELVQEQDVRPVMMFRRLILSLNVKCTHQSDGCSWENELSNLQNHLDNLCSYVLMNCTHGGCEEQIIRLHFEEHRNTCEYGPIVCEYCFASVVLKYKQIHLTKCPMLPLLCPLLCNAFIERKDISSHLEENCPLQEVECPYMSVGCKLKIQRKDMHEHCTNYLQKHTFFLLQSSKAKDEEIGLLKVEAKKREIEIQDLKNNRKLNTKIITRLSFLEELQNYTNTKEFHLWRCSAGFGKYNEGELVKLENGIGIKLSYQFKNYRQDVVLLNQMCSEKHLAFEKSFLGYNGCDFAIKTHTLEQFNKEGFVDNNILYILIK